MVAWRGQGWKGDAEEEEPQSRCPAPIWAPAAHSPRPLRAPSTAVPSRVLEFTAQPLQLRDSHQGPKNLESLGVSLPGDSGLPERTWAARGT